MFNNANNVTINNKEITSITMGGGILYEKTETETLKTIRVISMSFTQLIYDDTIYNLQPEAELTVPIQDITVTLRNKSTNTSRVVTIPEISIKNYTGMPSIDLDEL